MLEVMDSAMPCCAAVVQPCVVEWDTLSVAHGYLTAFVVLRNTGPFAARHYRYLSFDRRELSDGTPMYFLLGVPM